MSLIADALKAAQKARAKDDEAEDRARRVVSGAERTYVRLPGVAGTGPPRSLLLAGGGFVAAVILLVGVAVTMPGPEPPVVEAGEREAPPATGGEAAAAERRESTPDEPLEAEATAPGADRAVAAAPARLQTPETGTTGAEPSLPALTERQTRDLLAGTVAPGLEAPSARFRLAVEPAPAAEQLFRQGVAAHRRGAYAEAVTYYRQALARRPDDAELHNNLGTAYRSMGRLSDAETHFRRAIALVPDYAAAWSNLGVVLDARGAEQDAVAAYREALRHHPENAGAKVNLAQVYLALAAPDRAETLLREVLAADPAFAEAHYGLARVLDGAGDVAGAVRHYESFLTTSGGRFPELEPAVRRRLATLKGGG